MTEGEVLYQYNGLGQRTGKTENGREEQYLLDLTRPYHNLLGLTSGTKEQTFYWDGNAAALEEEGELHCYLQDELGSPLRVSGYGTKDSYLSYGYDEFGNDLYGETHADLEEAGIPNPYSRQGEEQPFGYTGYRMEGISGTYFAQAREYRPQDGRFGAKDLVKGTAVVPATLNRYGYCWGNPLKYVDLNGNNPTQIMQDAWFTAGQLSQSDGPLPFADMIALLILAGSAIYAGGVVVADYVSQKIENINEKTEEKVVVIEKTEDGQTIIYRKGNGNHANFTSRPGIDVGGLSYQFTKPVGEKYHMTTIEAVEATGVLVAIPDGENYISIIPTDIMQLQPWMDTRSGILNNGKGLVHPYTYLLEGITIAYFDENGLPREPGWLANERTRGNCLNE